MKDQQASYPQLRFKGFTDPWEERKLSEIGKIVTGNTPSTSNKGYYNGDFLFVSPADIQENRYVNKTTTTLTELGFKTGRLVPKGATLFVSIGSTIGKIGQSICDVITNQQINSVISFSDYDDDFIYTSILNSSTKIKQLAATQAVPIINKNEFGKSIIKIPSLEEQQKIGAFFKQLDDTIALHQRKLAKLKELKQGYLQKLFPRNGSKFPQLRFAGFADAWEERKLGEISRMYQPLTITGNDLLPDGVPVFGANGFIGFFSEANHIDDQVTISARGEGTGTPSYVHGPVWITGNSMVVNVGDFDIDKYFLFANLTANSLKKYVTGGAQPQLTRDVLVKVPITLPNTDEQKKLVPSSNNSMILSLFISVSLKNSKNLKKGIYKRCFADS
ncbi:restriction endonuclease subunit S [Lacticaseibacillus rhamnosus]|uniref:restriction endonuclease subunit S n=1 Tax=Lacticaseibacillus rhamnosus TaxID=47715 RepID=UPI000A8A4B21|nr:restriction endonuclease subunit S [Lacticaseibacillus rhamnosus]